jgi:hypothetical protein
MARVVATEPDVLVHHIPRAVKNVCRVAPLRRPIPRAAAGLTMGRCARLGSCAKPVPDARSYQYRVASTDFCAELCRWSGSTNRMEALGSTHSARPCATKRLARFAEVKRQSETGFSIRMFLRTVLLSGPFGIAGMPARIYSWRELSEGAPCARLIELSLRCKYTQVAGKM